MLGGGVKMTVCTDDLLIGYFSSPQANRPKKEKYHHGAALMRSDVRLAARHGMHIPPPIADQFPMAPIGRVNRWSEIRRREP
jgi:hypothetical protein